MRPIQIQRSFSFSSAVRIGTALAIIGGALLAGGCTGEAASTPADPVAAAATTEVRATFTDVAHEAGVAHLHQKPVLDAKLDNIMAWMSSVGAAVAAGDPDGDGWIDLYVTSSRKGTPNRLYRNLGGTGEARFVDVAPGSGLDAVNDERGVSTDAVWGDYDNDGRPDLYLVRWGRDSLYRNEGPDAEGQVIFTDVTDELFRRRDGRPGTDWANGNAAIFLDADRDGRLDVYVGNYFREVDLWNLETTRIMHDDFERSRNGGRNFFYHQQPDGSFRERARELGIDDPGWTLAVGAADLDGDGWPDLYSADDFGPDQLYVSNGDGTFRDVTESAKGYDTKKGMNVDFGDFDNDGWLDVYVTNITTAEYLQEGNMLWYNQGTESGELALVDVSLETGTYDGGWGWGGKFFDYDLDGDLDITTVNGFISAGEKSYWYDLASWTVLGKDTSEARNWPVIGERSFSGYERMRLFRNEGLYAFTEAGVEVGLASDRDGRGIAVVDYDNDGDPDLYIANQGQEPHLYRNDLVSPHHWLTVALEADPESERTNRDAIGARVTVVAGGRLQVRERDGGNGFSGQSDPRLLFGLGDAARAKLVEIRWPDGGYQYLEDVDADQILVVRQQPLRYGERREIEVEPAAPAPRPMPQPESLRPQPPALAPEEAERRLAELEQGLRRAPADHALASDYRDLAARAGAHDRALDFLEELADATGEPAARIELSVAYVDKIPTCGGLAAIVCKGSLAKKGLDHLDRVLAEHPDSWLATYSRGMNHLHWPRALRHSEDAARDLARAAEIQESAGVLEPHHLRVYVALGQAWAKAGEVEKAREAWRRGLRHFPDAAELRQHLEITGDDALVDHVLAARSLEQPVDTDLSFYKAKL